MIVRVMGMGQWTIEPEALDGLHDADVAVEQAARAGDQAALSQALGELLAGIQAAGTEVPDDVLAESDLVVPDPESSVADVMDLLDDSADFSGFLPDPAAESSTAD